MAVFQLAPNVLDRALTASASNPKWVADFRYVWTDEGWLFLAVVRDLFPRRVVGWAMQVQMTAGLVSDALRMAVQRRGPVNAVLVHSDLGTQLGLNGSSPQLMCSKIVAVRSRLRQWCAIAASSVGACSGQARRPLEYEPVMLSQ